MYSTQQGIFIEDINNDLVFLKDGGVSLLLSTSAVNFELLFETEQLAIIDAFAGMINSLSFPIQIIIRSKRLDISSYLHKLDDVIKQQTNPLIAEMTLSYRNFVEGLIKENDVLDKQFYVCLTAASVELGILSKDMATRTQRALTILSPRRDHINKQLSRIGLKSKQIPTLELIKLFYDIYNPNNWEYSKGEKEEQIPKQQINSFFPKDVPIVKTPLSSTPTTPPVTPAPLPSISSVQAPLAQTPNTVVQQSTSIISRAPLTPAPQQYIQPPSNLSQNTSSSNPVKPGPAAPFIVEELNDDS